MRREVTDGTHVTAGQLALALTPYAQVTDLAVNTAASGNNAAAIQSLDDRVTAKLASKLDSSAIAPLATAAALTRQVGVEDPYSTYSAYSKEPGDCGGSSGLACKTHIAPIAHIARSPETVAYAAPCRRSISGCPRCPQWEVESPTLDNSSSLFRGRFPNGFYST